MPSITSRNVGRLCASPILRVVISTLSVPIHIAIVDDARKICIVSCVIIIGIVMLIGLMGVVDRLISSQLGLGAILRVRISFFLKL